MTLPVLIEEERIRFEDEPTLSAWQTVSQRFIFTPECFPPSQCTSHDFIYVSRTFWRVRRRQLNFKPVFNAL